MPFQSDIIKHASLVMTDVYGIMTMDDRYDVLDRLLFAINKCDVRHVLMDLSMMSAENNALEELIFAEEMARHKDVFKRARQTVIHPMEFRGTIIPAKYMIRECIRVAEFELAKESSNRSGIARKF